MTEEAKSSWLTSYAGLIRRRLANCRRAPSWEHLPAGHMYVARGLTPAGAAKKYLSETSWLKSCKRGRR